MRRSICFAFFMTVALLVGFGMAQVMPPMIDKTTTSIRLNITYKDALETYDLTEFNKSDITCNHVKCVSTIHNGKYEIKIEFKAGDYTDQEILDLRDAAIKSKLEEAAAAIIANAGVQRVERKVNGIGKVVVE